MPVLDPRLGIDPRIEKILNIINLKKERYDSNNYFSEIKIRSALNSRYVDSVQSIDELKQMIYYHLETMRTNLINFIQDAKNKIEAV